MEEQDKLVGSYYILMALPLWATAAILEAVLLMIFVGRDIFEGLPYNIAYSSLIGDIGLMLAVLIGATILKRGEVKMSEWMQSKTAHILVLLLSVLLGIIVSVLTLSSRAGQIMDIYHDVIIAPLFLYLAVTLLPVIFKKGKKAEITAVLCFVLLWASLVVFDIEHGRMYQREWLQNHGVILLKN